MSLDHPEPVFELESVESTPTCYEMSVKISRDAQHRHVHLPIDEFTYLGVRRNLGELSPGDRYRLSLHCRWDPFQRQHFAVVTRISHNSRDILYFYCSERFRRSLLELESALGPGEPEEEIDAALGPCRKVTRAWAPRVAVVALFLLIGVISVAFGPDYRSEECGSSSVIADSQFNDAASTVEESKSDDKGWQPAESTAAVGEEHTNRASYEHYVEHANNEPEPEEVYSLTLEPGEKIYSLPEGHVALTFDDGPSPYTEQIVDILNEHGVAGTFFFIGEHVAEFPAAVEYASAEGMVVGNHSWSHRSLVDACAERLGREIVATGDLIQAITGSPADLFRPPYGLTDDKVSTFLAEKDMTTVMWNYDAKDWRVDSAEEIVDYVLGSEPCGGIYLLHETPLTIEALPVIIEFFEQKDLVLVVFDNGVTE